jgi:predicted peroxiredoxin
MPKRKRNIDEIRDELIELKVKEAKDFITTIHEHREFREGTKKYYEHIKQQNPEELYREAKKEGIEIYKPTKRKYGIRRLKTVDDRLL